jgi:hypothetical protein
MADEKKTLTDDEISSARTDAPDDESRRSVLTKIAGAVGAGALAAALPACHHRGYYYTGTMHATGITDSDGGPYADRAGYGRGRARGMGTGITDSDAGPYADPPGQGRGRYGMTSGVTDSDAGPYADPAGQGRGTMRMGTTGITDSDGGPYADPPGQGRGRWR